MELAQEIAEFFRHCLNFAGNVTFTNKIPSEWIGWMRCYVTPYLTDGKYKHDLDDSTLLIEDKSNYNRGFRHCLLTTLEDYIDFVECACDNEYNINRAKRLIEYVSVLTEDKLLSLIEIHYLFFPTAQDVKSGKIDKDTNWCSWCS